MKLYLYVFMHKDRETGVEREVYFYADSEASARIDFHDTFEYEVVDLVRREPW